MDTQNHARLHDSEPSQAPLTSFTRAVCDFSGSSIESRIDLKELANLWLPMRHCDRTGYLLKRLSVILEQKTNGIAEHFFDECPSVMLDTHFVHRVQVGQEIASPWHITLLVNAQAVQFSRS
jgi:hypothetical protein